MPSSLQVIPAARVVVQTGPCLPIGSGMSTPQAKSGAKLPFCRLSFDADRENQMSTSDRAPLFPQVPAYAEDPEHGTELQDLARHDTILSPAGHASESQVRVPIPSDLADAAGLNLDSITEDNVYEMAHLTYTAISTDPQEFYEKHHLRPKQFKFPRHTEILVGITVYNEPKHLLRRTLQSIVQNLWYLNIRPQSKTWGKGSWTKVVVCILIDGIESVDPGVLDVLTSIGLYQNGLCRKTTEQGEEVTGHLFEFTSHLATHLGCEDYTDGDKKSSNTESRPMKFPVQLMLLMKASNCGKLNSYRWLYNGFARVLDPNITVHLDVGTKLGKQALFKLWKEFDIEPMLAAACGEISCSLGGNWLNLLNPIVAAQNFEYKVGFQLDRTFESATGFLSLLPGACSAYRYVGSTGKPLEDMLLGDPTWIKGHNRDRPVLSPVNLNRHLADDRVICFRIISKPKTQWLLKYVPVTATTDIPMTTTDFINQRRRWLNGAFFSSIYVLKRCGHLWRSDHTRMRKLAFFIPLFHSVLALVLAWFSLAAFLLTTFTINSISGDPPKDAPTGGFPFGKATPIVNAVIQIVYLATVLFQFILALGSRPRNHRISYIISFAIFGLIQAYLIMNLIYLVKRVVDYKADDTGASNYAYIGEFYADIGQSTIIVAGFSVFGVYILSALLARDPLHLLTSFAQFLFISSSYVNILNIYAFSNTHDVSWGRKGRHEDTEAGQRQEGPRPATIERRFTFSDQDPNIRSADTKRDESPEARNNEYKQALARATAEEETNMFLYSLTLRPPTAASQAIVGHFSGTKEQQILMVSGSLLTLHRPDPTQGRVQTLLSQDLFSIIRSIDSFRLAGSSKGKQEISGNVNEWLRRRGRDRTDFLDYIIVATDSGSIAVLEYLSSQNSFSRIQLETFGKSGVRRTVPGQYLAADPKGRACIIASIEKNKLIYVFNRNAQAELIISSPLESHKHGVLVLSIVALDVGYSNPVFAALETDYSYSDRDSSGKASPDVELVYYELDLGLNHVVHKWSETVDPTSSMLFQVPGGNDGPSGVLVCGEENITYRHSNQDPLRVLIPRRRGASEDPQRKLTIIGGVMHKLKNSPEAFFFLLQTEDGDLFKLTFDMDYSESSLTGAVRSIRIKYFDTVPVASSLCVLKTGFLFVVCEFGNHHFYQFEGLGDDDAEPTATSDDNPTGSPAIYRSVYFNPRCLKNLTLVEKVDSLSPLLDCKLADLTGEGTPQIYSVSGNGARSHFRMLKHGLEINKVATSELPGTACGVWTTRLTRHDMYDLYITLTSSDNTVVMSVGDEVEQVNDSGFLATVTTLAIQQIAEGGLVQIHPKGIRHLLGGQINEWHVPQHRPIVAVATNERQIAITLSSGEIVYFEVDSDGSLAEYDEKEMISSTVTCLSLGPVPEGRLRSTVLAVGCEDCTVRILSLDPDSMLETKPMQALTAVPSALNIMAMEDPLSSSSGLYLHIGLNSGVYLRTGLDETTGELADTQTRFLGLKAIKLFQVTVKGQRIFSIENLYQNVVRKSLPLTYTPRHFVKHPQQPYFYTVEADNNTLGSELRAQLLASNDDQMNGDAKVLPPEMFGYPRGHSQWASCISIVDPIGEQVLQKIDLEGNEAAISVAVVPFTSQDGENFLLVGTGKDMILNPRQSSGGYIHIYRFQQNGRELEFMHKTKVEEPPMALVAFQGRLAAGIGKDFLIYDLGLKQLLRKAQVEAAPQLVVSLDTQGDRIVVGDVQQGVTMVAFDHGSQRLIPFVDDTIARWTTCTTMVDYESVVGGDKFGNIWIVRCPEKASQDVGDHARNYLNGAPNRFDSVAHFFTQDIPTSITKASLVVGGQDVIVWSGLQGTIGVLIPFVTREDADFFHALEVRMRIHDPSPVGREHLMYRGYYEPVKGVIDGDLCELYRSLPVEKKQHIAGELDRSAKEIERKISDIRSRYAF
ncbi:Pre-mRNA-splicing factor rse1 [Fusarium oxysporum f. sp. rapae]|uniref:chitin synthase n=1 Tax=Fusarium oxysporum f. sp. rapae TaxID=485398 RepID=A0A8J5PMX9_FUSOX|nr:Pre-mRNA-splicing factor rse1 [Fusarium oxysporum f. sp. rapae]